MIGKLKLLIWVWKIFLKNKNVLPTKSKIIKPKIEYELKSGSFIWEDEGLWGMQATFTRAFAYVIHHRMSLIVGPDNDIGVMQSKKFDKKVFEMAKKYFPDWIGFDKSRCSYNPELAKKAMKIRKINDEKLEQLVKEN